ncbi:hypothetical protein M7I_4033 [Glarea lozoyensis 74030]|uniref:Uncharacterized protein n=1 Tax=Glarea lozoyensis (strain ATCC 74030 / MF5533) TaxID=1104152 RepID=H0EN32_GLAL7|nr:hypothetical protein M7I_4033 [Glarea lozoyensis 74030]
MSKDSSYTYIHFNRARDADLFEDFCKDKLPDDEIYVPPHNQPINPEDEDDVVPDQHAATGGFDEEGAREEGEDGDGWDEEFAAMRMGGVRDEEGGGGVRREGVL